MIDKEAIVWPLVLLFQQLESGSTLYFPHTMCIITAQIPFQPFHSGKISSEVSLWACALDIFAFFQASGLTDGVYFLQ